MDCRAALLVSTADSPCGLERETSLHQVTWGTDSEADADWLQEVYRGIFSDITPLRKRRKLEQARDAVIHRGLR